MAFLEGTLDEIYTYLGPRTSDIVAQIARPFRKVNGHRISCGVENEDGSKCKQYTGLHAAHLKGKERKILIQEILNDSAIKIGEDVYRIELELFEVEFRKKHDKFLDVVKFMCPKHHKQYDLRNGIDHTQESQIMDREEIEEMFEINELIEEENLSFEDIKSLLNNKEFILYAFEEIKGKDNFEEIILTLTDVEKCKKLFKLNFPVLIAISDINDELYRRYYSNEFLTAQNGVKYKITNHWFKTQRELFENWIISIR